MRLLVVCALALVSSVTPAEPSIEVVFLATHSAAGHTPIKSWKTLRDQRIVKQDLDYSCGAASLATLLNEYYGQHLSEDNMLKVMEKGDGRASFNDMARALSQLGFKAHGFAASWGQLTQLKVPVIVYLKYRRDDHFSVLRGIDKNTIWLADPSLGNRTFSREQFLAMWDTRSEKVDAELKGKFLAVLPIRDDVTFSTDYFSKTPQRHSASAIAHLAHRLIP